MSMSFLSHLSARLSAGEQSFLLTHFDVAQETAEDVLRDLVSVTSTSRLLSAPAHTCANGCVCQSAIALLLQCLYERQRTPQEMQTFIDAYYTDTQHLPYELFKMWIPYNLAYARYEDCCNALIAYIDAHFSTSSAAAMVAAGPTAHLPIRSICTSHSPAHAFSHTDSDRYTELIELLLFHVLVPLGAHEEAMEFLRKGRRSTAAAAAAAHQQREERLPRALREKWTEQLEELHAIHYRNAVASEKLLLAGTDDMTVQNTKAQLHAGLTQLHAHTAYSNATANGLQPLLPAILPDPGELPPAAKDGALIDTSMSTEPSADAVAVRASSLELIPYPPPLPLVPDVAAAGFSWRVYIESLGHRLYALLYSYAPRLANYARVVCASVWQRRRAIYLLALCYIGSRLLLFLLRFVKHLPGVRLILKEVQTFMRIAFITGTGRSLFE